VLIILPPALAPRRRPRLTSNVRPHKVASLDAEALKLSLSVLSALVAIASAVIAYRTRLQTRIDLFETQRDDLLLAMSENDIRLRTIDYEASVLGTQLRAAIPGLDESTIVAIESLLNGLTELTSVLRALQRRDWSEDHMRRMRYSESSLRELRRCTLDEQVIARTIQAEAHKLLLEHARVEVQRLKRAV